VRRSETRGKITGTLICHIMAQYWQRAAVGGSGRQWEADGMRKLVIFMVRKIKRDPKYTLDPAMSTSAITTMLFNTLSKALRGGRRRIGFKRHKGLTFIGKHVTLRNKRYISVGRNLSLTTSFRAGGFSNMALPSEIVSPSGVSPSSAGRASMAALTSARV